MMLHLGSFSCMSVIALTEYFQASMMDAPIQLSFPLPRSLDTRIYLHLTVKAKAIVLFLTTASLEDAASPTPLGSFVYALPDVCPRFEYPFLVWNIDPANVDSEIQPQPAAGNGALHSGTDD